MRKKKEGTKNVENERRKFLQRGSLTLMGGMFAWTNLGADTAAAPDQPIASLLKLEKKGLTPKAMKLTPQDMMALANPSSSSGKKRISSRSYLGTVDFRDIGSLNGALEDRFGNGPILGADDDDDGGFPPCCCCSCCCA